MMLAVHPTWPSGLASTLVAALALAGTGRTAGPPQPPDADRQVLHTARIDTSGPGLLAFLRSRSLDDDDTKRLEALVQQLGDDSFEQREKASKAIADYGRLAVPFLRAGSHSRDLEIAHRSRRVLLRLDSGPGPELPLAAMALVRRQRPEGAAGAVLRYLPFAGDFYVEEAALLALEALAQRDGKADPVVVKALGDKEPLRRAAAGRALGSVTQPHVRALVRKLLRDAEPRVRLETARGLVFARDKQAVPALIELLLDGPDDIAGRAELVLFRVAGQATPQASIGNGSRQARVTWHDAWAAWWKANGGGVHLAKFKVRQRPLGAVIVAESLMYDFGGKVWQYGQGRGWGFDRYHFPLDVRVLPSGNVLVADSAGIDAGVSEREPAGKVVWRWTGGPSLAAQRFPNGNTFICQNTRLLEVDRSGKVLVSHVVSSDSLTDGLRLPNGNVAFISTRGVLKEITWPGRKEVKALHLLGRAPLRYDFFRLEAAPGGRFLVAASTEGRIFEIDASGRLLWEHKIPHAYTATRRANGNIVVGTVESKQIVELDSRLKVLRTAPQRGNITRVRER